MPRERPKSNTTTVTTLKVRSALAGDTGALEWVVRRLSPLLLAQARLRMHAQLRRICDPEDVVQDVWQRALPKLAAEIQPIEGRCTPRVVAYLAQILTYRVNELLCDMVRRRRKDLSPPGLTSGVGVSVERLPIDPAPAVWKPILLHDDVTRVLAIIEELDRVDKEIIVLRKFEGLASREVARKLKVTPNVVDTRLSRALDRLRVRIPDGVFDELAEEV